MKLDDVITLAHAGFTAEQIKGMFAAGDPAPADPAKKADPAPAKKADPAPAKKADPAPAKKADPAPADPAPAALDKIMARLDAIERGFKDTALKAATISKPAGETVDDILASIINPPKKEVIK